MSRRYFRLKRIALGLAFAAVAAPTAQAKPVPWTPAPQQPIASEISVQSPGSQLGATTIKLSGAALVNAPAPVSIQSPGSQLGPTTIKLSGAALVNAPAPVSVQSPGYSSTGRRPV